jgi:F0F1-type ATP synthase assembly protein I
VHNSWKGLGSYSTVGLELALSVLVGLFGGRWLDEKLHTSPWLTLAGFGFGIAAGARTVWRALQKANREALEQEEQDRKDRARFHEDDEKR